MRGTRTGAKLGPGRNAMTNLVLEHLHAIRTEQTASRERDAEILLRLGNIETAAARVGRHGSENYAELVEGRHELDKLKSRVDRIERRLEIID